MEEQRFDAESRKITGSGEFAEVSPNMLEAKETEFDIRARLARETHSHLWVVIVVHYASDTMLKAWVGETDETPLMDVETITQPPTLGCYLCEEPYSKEVAWRKCKGDAS